MSPPTEEPITTENIATLLAHDTKVKLAGVDADGILRGKLVAKKKFLSIAQDGFGFCSVIFGWDMHDRTYFKELSISNKENGYRDLLAIPDLQSFRRIPWEDNVPFFLVSFFDPETKEPISACPRNLLQASVDKLAKLEYKAMAGGISPVFLRCDGGMLNHQLNMNSTNSAFHTMHRAVSEIRQPQLHF
ncbi:hypothetical protein EIK77_005472 [Talaromyces pinophilus]|nr:hypothetical protein EIK77_005472 [Talaromyces pinophilus]